MSDEPNEEALVAAIKDAEDALNVAVHRAGAAGLRCFVEVTEVATFQHIEMPHVRVLVTKVLSAPAPLGSAISNLKPRL